MGKIETEAITLALISSVWYGMVWFGIVWYDMVWYGMVWYDRLEHSKKKGCQTKARTKVEDETHCNLSQEL